MGRSGFKLSGESWFVAILGLLAVVAFPVAFWPLGPSAKATPAEVFGVLPLLIAAVAFALPMGSAQAVHAWQGWIDRNRHLVWACPVVLWTLYAFGTAVSGNWVWSDVAMLAVYLPAPVAVALLHKPWVRFCEKRNLARAWGDLTDWALALVAWIPIQLKWIDLPTIPLPDGKDQVQIDPLLAAAVAFWALMVVRRMEGFQFRLFFDRKDAALGLRLYALFVVVALPLSLLTGFAEWGRAFTLHETEFQQPAWLVYPLLPIGMYFGVALIEEVLFRGLLQNLLARAFENKWAGLALASLAFGFVHFKFDNPSLYVVFATLAGGVYGYAYLKTGRIMGGAVCHALVNSTWLALFNPMAK